MKIAELRNGLGDLATMLGNFGASKQATELRALVASLSEFDDLTVPELTKRIQAVAAAAKKSTPKATDEAAVEHALQELQNSAHLSEAFDGVVDKVLKDKRLGKSELIELARRFGGTEPAKSTKAGVSQYLKERRLEIKRQGGLSATIDRMFGRTGT